MEDGRPVRATAELEGGETALKRILLVDDATNLAKALKLNLEQEGFSVSVAFDGRTALEKALKESFDLAILDIMLPEMDGLTVCREIRKRSRLPIVMLTAKDGDVDKILGLELGADDYVTKPFNTRELIARIRAVLRRIEEWSKSDAPQQIVVGQLVLTPGQRRAELNGKRLELTPREYDLLETLARRPGTVFSRQQLLDLVWGYEFDGEDRTVDVHVRRLREKLEPIPSTPQYLRTSRGAGYYVEEP